jgi:hypothetical protein
MVAKVIESKGAYRCEWSESSQETPLSVSDLSELYDSCTEHFLFGLKYESQAGVFWIETENFRCSDLTELLCNDDYEQILKINKEFYLVSINSQTNQLRIEQINPDEFLS